MGSPGAAGKNGKNGKNGKHGTNGKNQSPAPLSLKHVGLSSGTLTWLKAIDLRFKLSDDAVVRVTIEKRNQAGKWVIVEGTNAVELAGSDSVRISEPGLMSGNYRVGVQAARGRALTKTVDMPLHVA